MIYNKIKLDSKNNVISMETENNSKNSLYLMEQFAWMYGSAAIM